MEPINVNHHLGENLNRTDSPHPIATAERLRQRVAADLATLNSSI